MKLANTALVLLTVAIFVPSVAFCIALFVPRYKVVERSLAPHTTLTERYLMRRWAIPPLSDLLLEEQTLRYQGSTVWSSQIRTSRWLGAGFLMSPDEQLIAIAHWLGDAPIVILNMRTGTTTSVPEPAGMEDPGLAYRLTATGWSEDSRSLIGEVSGTFVKPEPDRGLMSYRETWLVDAATGVATRQSRKAWPCGETEPPNY